MGSLRFWIGIGAAQKAAGSEVKPTDRRRLFPLAPPLGTSEPAEPPGCLLFAAAALAPSARPKGRAMRCTVLGFTSNLAAALRTLMPPARAALIRSAKFVRDRRPAKSLTFTLGPL
jgi:hypothetical protein